MVKFGTHNLFIDSDQLKNRLGENIKRSRAAESRTIIHKCFDNLEISFSGVFA